MMKLTVSSQNIVGDSIIIHKRVFKSIVKESKKCDSLRLAFEKKDDLINKLIEDNISSHKEFIEIRKEKEIALSRLDQVKELSSNELEKRFSIGLSFGYYLGENFTLNNGVGLSVTYSLFRF